MKTAEEWIDEEKGQGAGQEGVAAPFNKWDIERIQSDARHSALTEAAEYVRLHAVAIASAVKDTSLATDIDKNLYSSSQTLAKMSEEILALRDGK